MMKNISIRFFLLIILFIQVSDNLSAQTSETLFSGVITDYETNEALEGVVCKVLDGNRRNIISYSLSDTNGKFTLSISKSDAFVLLFECLGFESEELKLSDITDHKNVSIHLQKKSVQLKEITVAIPPIQKSNDTISYNVSQFQDQSDRYVADILKKLPGINVNENGTISYQGEAISKFYIEGRDLLGGQYNIATNNLSIDAVSQIQVLENNQHIKALKDVEFSNKAAINIKLKKGFISKPFGEVEAGIGGFDPTLYNGQIFATLLGTKVQTITNFKSNNAGKNIMTEIEDKLDYSNPFVSELLPEDLITIPALKQIPIPLNRYLQNKTYLGGINNLIALSKDTELRTNLSYANNRINQFFFLQQVFATGNGNLEINEQTSQIAKANNYSASIILEHNSAKKYLKNETKSVGQWGKNATSINSDNRALATFNNNEPIYIQNSLQGLLKSRNDRTININSFFRYADKGELLNSDMRDSISSNLHEKVYGKSWIFKNKINSVLNVFKQRLDIGVLLSFESNEINSKINIHNIEGIDSLKSGFPPLDNKFSEFQVGLLLGYQIKHNKSVTTTINIPFSYRDYRTRNNNKSALSDSRIVTTPGMSNHYIINHLWELQTKIGYDWNYTNYKSLLSNSYFQSYRTIYMPSEILGTREGLVTSARIKYKDIINMLFFNFAASYSINKLNYMYETSNTENWSYYTTTGRDNLNRQILLVSNMSKTFAPIKTVLTLSPSFSQNSSKLIQQGNLIKNKSNNASLSLNIEVKTIKNASITYFAKGKVAWQNNNLTEKVYLKDWIQTLSVYYFPTKDIDLSAHSDYTISEIRKGDYNSNFFLDIMAKYQHKQVELSLSANNLLDKDYYSVTFLSTVNSTYQKLPLRGREFLFSTKFRF